MTSSDGQVTPFTSAGLSGYWVGNGDGVETHTHSFSQEVAGARVDFNAINTGEYLSFEIDGVTVDLNTLVATGDAIFDGANAYGIDGSGKIIETGPDNNETTGSVSFLRPFTSIDVISSVDAAGSGIVYEMHVDTNPPTHSDNDFLSGGDDSDTFVIEDAFGNDTITGGEGGTDFDVIDLSGLGGSVTATYDSTGAESGTITDGIDTITFSEIERVVLTEFDDSVDGSVTNSGEVGDVPGIDVDGRGGDDSIHGGRGDDTITGGPGDDCLTGGSGNDVFDFSVGDGSDTITDFNVGNTGTIDDGDVTNNDFIDLSQYYTNLFELRADFDDDNVLNQSDSGTDYSDNSTMGSGDAITFSGADRNSFTADNTGVVCFASGTLILTEKGEIPVEWLRVDDRIVTYDNGLQPLAMLASRRLGLEELSRNPALKPIELKPGSLGSEHRLVVSPQHMLLVRHDGGEALVRARQLARLRGGAVRLMEGCRQVTYFHLIFDAHQIVFANRRPAESFFPGPRALAALDREARREFLMLFTDFQTFGLSDRQRNRWDMARCGIRMGCLPETVAKLSSPALQ